MALLIIYATCVGVPHAHTADACVQAFFASLKSWQDRRNRKTSPAAQVVLPY
ncbi:MAG: hypothetical protein ABI465_19495 [Ktedonobacteraceae bacterium]